NWPSLRCKTFSFELPALRQKRATMRKVLIIALRDYMATVRTKGFLIGLTIMPILMGGGFLAQQILGDQLDVRARHIAVVDRSPGGKLAELLKEKADAYNHRILNAEKSGQGPAFAVEIVEPESNVDAQRLHL